MGPGGLIAIAVLTAMGHVPGQIDNRQPLYYADHTSPLSGYPVDAAAADWSQNPNVRLEPVRDCTPATVPCVTIYDTDWIDGGGGPTPDGDWTAPDGTYPGGVDQTVILLSHQGDRYMGSIGRLAEFKRFLICHELGHYVLNQGNEAHALPGCMHGFGWFHPGRRALTLVPAVADRLPPQWPGG